MTEIAISMAAAAGLFSLYGIVSVSLRFAESFRKKEMETEWANRSDDQLDQMRTLAVSTYNWWAQVNNAFAAPEREKALALIARIDSELLRRSSVATGELR